MHLKHLSQELINEWKEKERIVKSNEHKLILGMMLEYHCSVTMNYSILSSTIDTFSSLGGKITENTDLEKRLKIASLVSDIENICDDVERYVTPVLLDSKDSQSGNRWKDEDTQSNINSNSNQNKKHKNNKKSNITAPPPAAATLAIDDVDGNLSSSDSSGIEIKDHTLLHPNMIEQECVDSFKLNFEDHVNNILIKNPDHVVKRVYQQLLCEIKIQACLHYLRCGLYAMKKQGVSINSFIVPFLRTVNKYFGEKKGSSSSSSSTSAKDPDANIIQRVLLLRDELQNEMKDVMSWKHHEKEMKRSAATSSSSSNKSQKKESTTNIKGKKSNSSENEEESQNDEDGDSYLNQEIFVGLVREYLLDTHDFGMFFKTMRTFARTVQVSAFKVPTLLKNLRNQESYHERNVTSSQQSQQQQSQPEVKKVEESDNEQEEKKKEKLIPKLNLNVAKQEDDAASKAITRAKLQEVIESSQENQKEEELKSQKVWKEKPIASKSLQQEKSLKRVRNAIENNGNKKDDDGDDDDDKDDIENASEDEQEFRDTSKSKSSDSQFSELSTPPSMDFDESEPKFKEMKKSSKSPIGGSRLRFSDEEVRYLIDGVKKYGKGNWSEILHDPTYKFHAKRTTVNLKDKWRNIESTKLR